MESAVGSSSPPALTRNSSTSSAATFQRENLVHARSASRATESLLMASSSANDPTVHAGPITRAMKTTT